MRAWCYCSAFPRGGEGLDALFNLYRPEFLCFTREPSPALSTIPAPENDKAQRQSIHLLLRPVEDPSRLTPQVAIG